jgi:acetylornithine deacetylase
MIKAPDMLDMMRALVAAPSASSFDPAVDQGNLLVIDLLATWLEGLGFTIEKQDLPGRAPRANLVARLGDGPGGLVLSGHADTVGCEHGRWSRDPYVLTEDDGRYYGLGIADMKVFFATSIEAAKRFRGNSLHEPLYIVATADEECAMEGVRQLVEADTLRARYAVIGEPTALEPVRMHKGMMMTRVVLTGRSGHSSAPGAGASALDAMIDVCNEMISWRVQLGEKHRNDDFAVSVPTLNLGTMHGGDHPNRICGRCEMHMDLRPLPGMDIDVLHTDMRARVEQAIMGRGVTLEMESMFPGTPPMHTPADSALVRFAEEVTGRRAGSASYGTEAPHFARLGTDALLLGPGDIAQAHQPDEFVLGERLEPTVEILAQMINRFCQST